AGTGTGAHQRRASAVPDRVLAEAGHCQGSGALDPERWHTARGHHQPAAGEPVPAPAGPADDGERLSAGALRRRLRDPVSKRGGGAASAGGGAGMDPGQWPDPASGEDPYRGLPAARAGFCGSGLPLRSASALGAQEEPESAQGQGAGQDAPDLWSEPGATDRRTQPDAAGLVRLLPARPSVDLRAAGPVYPAPLTGGAAQTGKAA